MTSVDQPLTEKAFHLFMTKFERDLEKKSATKADLQELREEIRERFATKDELRELITAVDAYHAEVKTWRLEQQTTTALAIRIREVLVRRELTTEAELTLA